MCMHAKLLQSCPILCDPMDCIACLAPLSMEFYKQEYWRGQPFPSPGDPPDLGVEPTSVMSLALAGRFFTTRTTWEALISTQKSKNKQTVKILFKQKQTYENFKSNGNENLAGSLFSKLENNFREMDCNNIFMYWKTQYLKDVTFPWYNSIQ